MDASVLKSAEVSARIIRADGSVEDLGVVASTQMGNLDITKEEGIFLKMLKKLLRGNR